VCGAKKEREVSFVGSEGCDQNFCATVYNSKPCFVCFGAASPRTLSSGRKGTMLASRQQTTVADENKKHVEQHGGKPIPPSKPAGTGKQHNNNKNISHNVAKAVQQQVSNRRALGDIGNLVAAMPVRSNVSKESIQE
jgi:hypothetical protein